MTKFDQYVLIDDLVLHRIIRYADIHPRDVILEIGAGTGVLTEELMKHAERVIAIESDASLVRLLDQRLKNTSAEIIHGDALEIEFSTFKFNKVVSNLPYSISSTITFKLLRYPFERAVLMYQYEFARRMAAPPGSKDYGRLSICVQYHADVELLEIVPPEAFSPEPGVRSAIVRLTPRAPEYEVSDPAFFSRFLTAIFSQRRKKLKNSIRAFTDIRDLELPDDVLDKRPEELPAKRLAQISDILYSRMRLPCS
ncbi:ribosomal RNA small subunit methyltransferase A [ANME-2 cluster archaeon]|nr:MAG: ribosomal RNA small subunit methyltransferase A [ANME-2 cluster archaeon]